MLPTLYILATLCLLARGTDAEVVRRLSSKANDTNHNDQGKD